MCRRRRLRSVLVPVLLAACGVAAGGEPQDYTVDPVHTRVLFEIDHAGFSKAIGTVSGSQGQLRFDPDDWSTASLDVVVPMQRLEMGDSDMLAAVFAPRFLDVRRYPQARFVSTAVTREAGNRGTVCGRLTLHGVTRPLCMALVLNRLARHPLPPFRRTAGFSATASLSRSDFGMTAWRSLVGDTVLLRIEAELVRRRGGPDSPATDAAPAVDDAPAVEPDPDQE